MGTLWHNSHPHVEALACHALHRTFIGVASAKFLHLGVQRVTISWMEKEGNTITRHILDRLQRELNLNNAEMEIIKTFLDIPRASEATTVSHSDTSAQQVSFPDSDHVAESKAFLSGSCRKLRPARWHLR